MHFALIAIIAILLVGGGAWVAMNGAPMADGQGTTQNKDAMPMQEVQPTPTAEEAEAVNTAEIDAQIDADLKAIDAALQ